MYCEVRPERVIAVHDLPLTYRVPVFLEEEQGLVPLLREILQLDTLKIRQEDQKQGAAIWEKWKEITSYNINPSNSVKIALVGKYTSLHDAYLSVIKSLEHACMACGSKLELLWVDASHLELESEQQHPAEYYKAWHSVTSADGILVPGYALRFERR